MRAAFIQQTWRTPLVYGLQLRADQAAKLPVLPNIPRSRIVGTILGSRHMEENLDAIGILEGTDKSSIGHGYLRHYDRQRRKNTLER